MPKECVNNLQFMHEWFIEYICEPKTFADGFGDLA